MSPKVSIPAMQLIQIAMKESIKKAFSKYLLPTTEILHLNESNSISFKYKVPDILCHKGEKENHFSVAAILAVFDELSSYSLMMKDKTCRGGVSLHLTTEIVDICVDGTDVNAIITTDKVGKSIGFCTMLLTDINGKVLARGKHVKFMPMGFLWDILASKIFLPFTLALYNFSQTPVGKFINSLFQKKKKETINIPELSGIGAVIDSIQLKEMTNDMSTLKNIPSGAKVYEFFVRRQHTNILGKLHGGALGMVIEKSCLQSQKHSKLVFIQSIDVKYLSPMTGDLLIAVYDDPYHADCYLGSVLNKKDGSICAEFICYLELLPSML